MKVNEIITNEIIKKLENGDLVWRKGWTVREPKNYITGKEYQGINWLLLSMGGYSSEYFLTFNQIKDKGGKLKAGAKSQIVCFYTQLKDKEDEEKSIPLLRYYRVFNLDDVEGIDTKETATREFTPQEEAEAIINGYKNSPKINYKGGRAFYTPSTDEITIPSREMFKGEAEFYSTIYHEIAHSTGAAHRLNRKEMQELASFGDENYSKEELTAELTAAFLCSKAGIGERVIDNQAAYIKGWLNALKDDKSLVIRAASQAQKAYNYILNK